MIELVAIYASALLTAAAPAAAEAAFTPARQPEKLICRRYQETGSLAKRKRVCHTTADWKRIDDASQRNLDYIRNARNGTNYENGQNPGAGIPLGTCPPQC